MGSAPKRKKKNEMQQGNEFYLVCAPRQTTSPESTGYVQNQHRLLVNSSVLKTMTKLIYVLLETHVCLLIHTNYSSAAHVATMQYIKSGRYKSRALIDIKPLEWEDM